MTDDRLNPERPWETPKTNAGAEVSKPSPLGSGALPLRGPAAPRARGRMGFGGIGCLILVGLVVIICIGAAVTSSTQSETDRHDDATYATVLCEKKVTDALSSPSTAKFGNVLATRTANLTWTVTGDVDAQNGFGAEIRNHFDCTMEVRESDGFTRTNLNSLG